MPDVFISYNREDRPRAGKIAEALTAEGLDVWWDADLRAGESYDEVTERNLREAGAVVVLWSQRSANSKWVRAEATIGERASTLVPAMIEECERPLRFELVQTADLVQWHGDRQDPKWRDFVHDVRTAIGDHDIVVQKGGPTPTSGSGDATIEATFWNSIKDGDDRSDFEAYLKRYPKGHFADLARNRLKQASKAKRPPQQKASRAAGANQSSQVKQSTQRAQRKQKPPRAATSGFPVFGALVSLLLIGAIGGFFLAQNGTFGEDVKSQLQAVLGGEWAASGSDGQGPKTSASGVVTAFSDCENCPAMMAIPGGTFMMGSPKDERGHLAYEGPQRSVTIAPFALGAQEITHAQWLTCVTDGGCRGYKPTDAGFGRENRPVLSISYRDANAYVTWLKEKTGKPYRLPTEAEWEYAARAGTDTPYWWGEAFDRSRVALGKTGTVSGREPNPFGLNDMLGNVSEWVSDCYRNTYTDAPTDGSAVTQGDCGRRVVRGGNWKSKAVDIRAANRKRIGVDVRDRSIGFRVAMDSADKG